MDNGKIIKSAKKVYAWPADTVASFKWKVYNAAAHGKIPFPDKAFQKWDYKVNCGGKLNLKNPKTFQDKLQWMKLYYRRPEFTQMVDKYSAREWVASKIGEEYLVPLYGVYNFFDEIDFDVLPEKFVLKCTHDSGSVIFCRDKAKLDKKAARETLEAGLKRNQFYLSREWPYKNVPPRIICEHFLIDAKTINIPDYKFFCFDGEIKAFLINSDRHADSETKTNFYYPDWTLMPIRDMDYPTNPEPDEKPLHFDKMVELAKILSAGLPHVRVDFNYVNDKIYFGEMTFYHCGGRKPFVPAEYNDLFGSWITLPEKVKNK